MKPAEPWVAGLVLATVASVTSAACPPLLDFRLKTIEGKTLDLCAFEGKPILVVNTASRCGFTPQFEKLESLHQRYGAQGLVILGFPSNDFRQEPGSNQAVGDFCRTLYGVKFPMIEKSSVTGDAANPFFRKLATLAGEPPRWNFHKYLVAPDGRTVHSFQTHVEPDAPMVVDRLVPMLRK